MTALVAKLKKLFKACSIHWNQISYRRKTREVVKDLDPLQLLGKSLGDTTLDDFSEGWDKTNEENTLCGLMQLHYPLRHAELLETIQG